MHPIFITLIILASLILLFLFGEYIVYLLAFYNSTKKSWRESDEVLSGPQYDRFHDIQMSLIKDARSIPYKEVYIKSFDHKKLHARVYEGDKNKTFIICVHGYRGYCEKDFAGGMPYFVRKGHTVILPDNRGHGDSSGHTITFGIQDRKDVRKWIDYLLKTYGNDIDILIMGISMGGATTLMMGDQNLPKNVKGLLADCPYASAVDEIKYVITNNMHLPAFMIHFVKLAALIYGHFNLNEMDAYRSLKMINLPVLIIHGDDDRYVPQEQDIKLKDLFKDRLTYVSIHNAPHGLSFCEDLDTYSKAIEKFFDDNSIK